MNTLKNKVNLIGNLGALPQVREVAQGRKVARMTVATHNSYRNASGERVTDTQWHTVVAWGRIADQVQRLLAKGTPVMVDGRLVHRTYTGKEGLKRHITEVVLSEFKVITFVKKVEEALLEAA